MSNRETTNNSISHEEIKTKKIVIVDENDQPRIILATVPDGYGSPFIALLDNARKTRIQIVGKNDTGAIMVFFDDKEKSRIEVKVMQEGAAGLTLNYQDGEKRHFDIFSDGQGDAFITISDKEGKPGRLLLFGNIERP